MVCCLCRFVLNHKCFSKDCENCLNLLVIIGLQGYICFFAMHGGRIKFCITRIFGISVNFLSQFTLPWFADFFQGHIHIIATHRFNLGLIWIHFQCSFSAHLHLKTEFSNLAVISHLFTTIHLKVWKSLTLIVQSFGQIQNNS